MADNNPLRGPNLTCSNEIRRLVVRVLNNLIAIRAQVLTPIFTIL